MGVEEKLAELGLELPSSAAPVGNYLPAVRAGNLVFLSGHGPVGKDRVVAGKLGKELTVEEGYEAAKLVALGLLGSLRSLIGGESSARASRRVGAPPSVVPTGMTKSSIP